MDHKLSKITVPSHVGVPGNETAHEAAKKELNEEIQHYKNYSQDLIKWMKHQENQQEKWE
jgi:hypothetical protein